MVDFLRRVFGETRMMDATVRRLEDADIPKAERNKRILRVLQSYEAFKLIQRLFALMILFVYIGVFVICVIAYFGMLVLGEDPEPVKEMILLLNDTLAYAFITTVALYLGGGVGEGLIERWKAGRGESKNADS